MRKPSTIFLFHDVAVILLSVLIAIVLAKTGILLVFLKNTAGTDIVGAFIAGMFFTSVFTTPPAIVVLGEIAQVKSLFGTAFFGACGAVVGDLMMFRFFRDRFFGHVGQVIGGGKKWRKVQRLFRKKSFRWLTFFLGGLVIASPLPDELGIGLLGMSHLRLRWFIPLSFVFNFLGITMIGLIARALFST